MSVSIVLRFIKETRNYFCTAETQLLECLMLECKSALKAET